MSGKQISFAMLAGSLLAALALPLRPTLVLGQSMEPALRSGGCYVLNTGYYRHHAIRRGDIVVFRHSGQTYIKRVYALPGQRIPMLRYDDNIGNQIVEPWEMQELQRLAGEHRLPDKWLEDVVVPPGSCFVVGDNRLVSYDSRSFGCIPICEILGRVF